MSTGRPQIFDHDVRLKMTSELRDKLVAAAAKVRRTLPDFMRLVLEDAVAQPQDQSLRNPERDGGWTRLKSGAIRRNKK